MFWKKPSLEEESSESLKKREKELEKALALQEKEMEKALAKKKQLETAVKQKKEIEKVVPSEKKIDKDLLKASKGTTVNKQKNEILLKRLKLVAVLLVLFLAFALLFSEFFLQPFAPKQPIQSSFIIETCTFPTFSDCKFEITDSQATLTFNPRNFIPTSITNPNCKEYEIPSPGKIVFSDCSFSMVSNNLEITISYENQESGLVHQEKGKIIKLIETTTLGYLTSGGAEEISGFITAISKNNNTYK